MKLSTFTLLLFIICLVLLGCSNTQNGATENSPSTAQYQCVENWPSLPDTFLLGNPTGIGIDDKENIYVFHRAGREWTEPMPEEKISAATILKLNKNSGKLLDSWGENRFIMPHGLTVDHENNIWLTDVGLHQVFKFSASGNLLLTLGEAGVAGADSLHFNLPTDVAVAADGSFYVSDGYGNSRIVKFAADGTYLFEWGTKGEMQGEFDTPHAIDIDNQGNIYVADRENNRIQVFDGKGSFLSEWKNKKASQQLYSVTVDQNSQDVFAIDFQVDPASEEWIPQGSDVIKLNSDLQPVTQFGRTAAYDGPLTRYHDISVDKEGNLYVGDILENRIQKFEVINQ